MLVLRPMESLMEPKIDDSRGVSERSAPLATVVIPAHDEAKVIARLLRGLQPLAEVPVEVLVVCNGCRDDSAAVARATGVPTQVVELAEASKRLALERGDQLAKAYPRVYIDADVVIDTPSVLALVSALQDGRYLAAGPQRQIVFDHANRLVRWYYDVWVRLPAVQSGLFGRGVIALSRVGAERVRRSPALMADDLVASEVFEPTERIVVAAAQSTIYPPRTMRDLVRRRARAATGNAQADRHRLRRPESVTSPRTLLSIAWAEPVLFPKVFVFLGVALTAGAIARRAIRIEDFDTWQRDESSRSG